MSWTCTLEKLQKYTCIINGFKKTSLYIANSRTHLLVGRIIYKRKFKSKISDELACISLHLNTIHVLTTKIKISGLGKTNNITIISTIVIKGEKIEH